MLSETSRIIRSVSDLSKSIDSFKKAGKSIALVPTMGALHEGHLSLIRLAKKNADVVVCTIFVNPTQFNDKKDLEKYPRTEEKDAELLNKEKCDIIFIPLMHEVYPVGHVPLKISYNGLDKVMEGDYRPGHFDGVVEVVARLFQMTHPDVACFGEKDFQQLAVIQELVAQHDFPILIIPGPIVREEHGLAMSSRNERLTAAQRSDASILYKTLNDMKKMAAFMNPDELASWGRDKISACECCELEYLEVAESHNLQPIYRWKETDSSRAFIVARFGEIRLIDNLQLLP
jgi:pantoate--beta-alanine ligase